MIVEMDKRRSCRGGYTYTETINGGQTGNTIRILPASSQGPITCTIIAGSNAGKFQFTTSPDTAVNDATCVWNDWPLENISGTRSFVVTSPITAIRGVSVSGSITIEIVR